jgi:lipopolysaccharide/colanic/teichoic acid biosynthesis glycosyltransferase
MQLYRNFLKRSFDLIISLLAFCFLLPLFIVVTVLLFIANQGSPFFIQPRPGKNERIFRLVKFKTMSDKKDAVGNLLPDAERLTPVGKFIRKTSLDEIPQLINVIKGEMSLIGPRPLLVEYLPLYNDTQKRRHHVRPGITGWAQVNGRNAIGWKEKFELDVWYVDNVSFGLDCKIILFTLMKVVKSEGVSQQGHATMPKFDGR